MDTSELERKAAEVVLETLRKISEKSLNTYFTPTIVWLRLDTASLESEGLEAYNDCVKAWEGNTIHAGQKLYDVGNILDKLEKQGKIRKVLYDGHSSAVHPIYRALEKERNEETDSREELDKQIDERLRDDDKKKQIFTGNEED